MPEVPRNWTSGFLFLIVINSKYPFYKIFFCCHDILFCCKVIEKKAFLANATGVVGTAFVCFAFQFSNSKTKKSFRQRRDRGSSIGHNNM